MADESYWVDRAQSAEAKLATLKGAIEPTLERVRAFKANFGVIERHDGALVINYDHFAKALGIESALELRKVIDETYSITGGAGEKPRIKVTAAAA